MIKRTTNSLHSHLTGFRNSKGDRSDMHFYRAYNLAIASAIVLDRLPPSENRSADVTIELLPSDFESDQTEFTRKFANWQAGDRCFLLTIDQVAQFHVTEGSRIAIKPAVGARPQDISAYLMGSAFAAILQQRGLLTLHASGVMTKAGAALFIGHSGIGKSTTLAALSERGFGMITDDIAAIRSSSDGVPHIIPSFAGSKLTPATLAQLDKKRGDFRKLGADLEKYHFPLQLAGFDAVPISQIILLEGHREDTFELEKLAQGDAFAAASFFTFRKRFYDGMGLERAHFAAVSKLVSSVPIYRLRRPVQEFLLGEMIELVMPQLGAHADIGNTIADDV